MYTLWSLMNLYTVCPDNHNESAVCHRPGSYHECQSYLQQEKPLTNFNTMFCIFLIQISPISSTSLLEKYRDLLSDPFHIHFILEDWLRYPKLKKKYVSSYLKICQPHHSIHDKIKNQLYNYQIYHFLISTKFSKIGPHTSRAQHTPFADSGICFSQHSHI